MLRTHAVASPRGCIHRQRRGGNVRPHCQRPRAHPMHRTKSPSCPRRGLHSTRPWNPPECLIVIGARSLWAPSGKPNWLAGALARGGVLFATPEACNSPEKTNTKFMQAFTTLPPDTVAVFWSDIGRQCSTEKMDQYMSDFLIRRRTTTDHSPNLGRYLPRNVYVRRGFDGDLLEANCTGTTT